MWISKIIRPMPSLAAAVDAVMCLGRTSVSVDPFVHCPISNIVASPIGPILAWEPKGRPDSLGVTMSLCSRRVHPAIAVGAVLSLTSIDRTSLPVHSLGLTSSPQPLVVNTAVAK